MHEVEIAPRIWMCTKGICIGDGSVSNKQDVSERETICPDEPNPSIDWAKIVPDNARLTNARSQKSGVRSQKSLCRPKES